MDMNAYLSAKTKRIKDIGEFEKKKKSKQKEVKKNPFAVQQYHPHTCCISPCSANQTMPGYHILTINLCPRVQNGTAPI